MSTIDGRPASTINYHNPKDREYLHREHYEPVMPGNKEFYKQFDINPDKTRIINAAEGGMYGFAPNNFKYVAEQPYVSQRPYCVVLSTPSAFSDIPGGDVLHGLLRAFMETRSRSWSGLTSRTSTEYIDIQWAGGSTLSFPSGSTRQHGTITHEALDPEGESFSKLIDIWQEYLLSDVRIRQPKMYQLGYGGDLFLDEISMSSVYFEPTRNMRDIRRACLVMAQMPKDGVQYDMSYDSQETAGKTREISLELTGLFEWNTLAAREIARMCLARMPIYNPNGRGIPKGFDKLSKGLRELKGNNGIFNVMDTEAKSIKDPSFIA